MLSLRSSVQSHLNKTPSILPCYYPPPPQLELEEIFEGKLQEFLSAFRSEEEKKKADKIAGKGEAERGAKRTAKALYRLPT